jgi:hypothetical protein
MAVRRHTNETPVSGDRTLAGLMTALVVVLEDGIAAKLGSVESEFTEPDRDPVSRFRAYGQHYFLPI